MLSLKRPPKPPNFEKRVTRHRERVKQHVDSLTTKLPCSSTAHEAVGRPSRTRIKEKKKDLFASKWSEFKNVFSRAQHGKCAYCEVSVIGAQHGDVEHYHPKAQVQALEDDPETWGNERPYLSNVEGRKPKVLCETGYWWLAYDWSNYLLSCMVCNEYWKGAIFPVEEDPRTLPPRADKNEVALLLNPYDDINPAEHLSFDRLGQIHPNDGNRRGFELIRTCGLDRPSLQNIRSGIATEVWAETEKLATVDEPGRLKEILAGLYLKGVESNHHPGMVRIIIEQRTDLTWKELVEQLTRLHVRDLVEARSPQRRMKPLLDLYDMGNESREDAARIRAIVEECCGEQWETLIRGLACSVTDLLKGKAGEKNRASTLIFLHQMASCGPHSLETVKDVVRSECGLSWQALENEVHSLQRQESGKKLAFY